MRVETALIFADVGNRPFHRPDRAGRLKVRHRSVSFPRREQYNSFRQIVQRFFAVPSCFCTVPRRSRVLLCGSPALLCGSLWFPRGVLWFPARLCAVPRARVCSPRRGAGMRKTPSLSGGRDTPLTAPSEREPIWKERRSRNGAALFLRLWAAVYLTGS